VANIGHYVTRSQTTAGCKEVDPEVRNPEEINAAIQHCETSQTIIQSVIPTSGEIPDFIYDMPEPPEVILLDDNISTIAANIAGPSMLFIPHQAQSGRKQMQDAIANDGEVLDPGKRSRKEKRCWKCFIDKCPGRVLRGNCPNACASCNRKDCRGKDSRHPSFPCQKLRNQSS
jgi:hypothetical protein